MLYSVVQCIVVGYVIALATAIIMLMLRRCQDGSRCSARQAEEWYWIRTTEL